MKRVEVEVRRESQEIIVSPNRNPIHLIDAEPGEACWISVTGTGFPFRYIGPVTAVLNFVRGEQAFAAEVDVPIKTAVSDGGCMIVVPRHFTKLRVFIRDDSNLVTPSRGGHFGCPRGIDWAGETIGVVTDNIPRGDGSWRETREEVQPFLGVGKTSKWSGSRSRNTKTIWVYDSLPGHDIIVEDLSAEFDGHPAFYYVPPFAKSVSVCQNEAHIPGYSTLPVVLTLYEGIGVLFGQKTFKEENQHIIKERESLELPVGAMVIGVHTVSHVSSLALIFEVGL